MRPIARFVTERPLHWPTPMVMAFAMPMRSWDVWTRPLATTMTQQPMRGVVTSQRRPARFVRTDRSFFLTTMVTAFATQTKPRAARTREPATTQRAHPTTMVRASSRHVRDVWTTPHATTIRLGPSRTIRSATMPAASVAPTIKPATTTQTPPSMTIPAISRAAWDAQTIRLATTMKPPPSRTAPARIRISITIATATACSISMATASATSSKSSAARTTRHATTMLLQRTTKAVSTLR